MAAPDHSDAEEILVEGPGRGVIVDYRLDQRHIPQESWTNARNMRMLANGTKVRKMDSLSTFDSSQTAYTRSLMNYINLDQTETLVRVLLATAGSGFGAGFTQIQSGLVGTADNPVTWDQYQNLLVWTDKADVPQMWSGSGAAGPLGGNPNKSQIVVAHKEHIVFFNCIDFATSTNVPFRMQWSGVGNPQVFSPATDPTAGQLDFDEGGGGFIAAGVLGDFIVAHRKNIIHRIAFVGFPGGYIQEPLWTGDGAISPKCLYRRGPYQYFMGRKNFYRLSAYPEPIGDPIWQKVLDVVDFNQKHKIFCYERPEFEELVWVCPSNDSGMISTQPDFSFVYNTRDNTWTFCDGNYNPGTAFVKISLPTGSVVDTWIGGEANSWATGSHIPWGFSPVALTQDYSLIVNQNGLIQQYAGPKTNIRGSFKCFVESKAFQLDAIRQARLLRIPIVAEGSGMVLVSRKSWRTDDLPEPLIFTTAGTYNLDAFQLPWVNSRGWGRLHKIRFENNALTDDVEIEMYGLTYIPGGGDR